MNTDNCIFCRIANGTMGTDLLYEDDKVVAFKDIHPQAPVHILVIPKKPMARIADMEDGDRELVGHLFQVASRVAAQEKYLMALEEFGDRQKACAFAERDYKTIKTWRDRYPEFRRREREI